MISSLGAQKDKILIATMVVLTVGVIVPGAFAGQRR